MSIDQAAEWLKAVNLPTDFRGRHARRTSDRSGGGPDTTREVLYALAIGGTITLSARFVHHALAHHLEQLHALVELNRED